MYLVVKIGNGEVILTEENSVVYQFKHSCQIDHVFVETKAQVFYIFDCPQLIHALTESGCIAIIADHPTHDDVDAYVQFSTNQVDAELEHLT